MIINHELLPFNTDTCYFGISVPEHLIAKYLKGAYGSNLPRFRKRFVDFFESCFKAHDLEYLTDIIKNIETLWHQVEPYSYKEAFEISNQEFRIKVFSSIDIVEMINELGSTRIKTEGKDLINKTWNQTLQKFEEKPYTVVYELHHVNGEKLGLSGQALPVIRCWCTTTDEEHWLWVNNVKDNSPLEGIASTCVIYKSMLGKIKHIIRQGDVFLFEMAEECVPSEDDELMSLPMETYFGLLKSQA